MTKGMSESKSVKFFKRLDILSNQSDKLRHYKESYSTYQYFCKRTASSIGNIVDSNKIWNDYLKRF